MNILVLGATGGTGKAVVEELLERGHRVSALCRRPDAIDTTDPRLTAIVGDATNPDDVHRAVAGHDAVVVALGIRENPLRVRLMGTRHTPLNVRSEGTKNVIDAMHTHGVRKLIVQTTYGVGQTRGRLPLKWKLLFSLLLAPQIDDTEAQEAVVRDSDLEWTLIQPVALTDASGDERTLASRSGETVSMSISRRSVAHGIGDALSDPTAVGQTIALSAA